MCFLLVTVPKSSIYKCALRICCWCRTETATCRVRFAFAPVVYGEYTRCGKPHLPCISCLITLKTSLYRCASVMCFLRVTVLKSSINKYALCFKIKIDCNQKIAVYWCFIMQVLQIRVRRPWCRLRHQV